MNRNISRPHNFSRWLSSSVSAENGLLANRALLPTDFSADSSAIDEYFNDDEEFSRISAAKKAQAKILLETKISNPSLTTLAELTKYSPDLQKLVALGVSLREVEECDGAPDLLANLKYYPHIHGE